MKKKILIGIIIAAVLVVGVVLGVVLMNPDNNDNATTTSTTTTATHIHEFGEWSIVKSPTCSMEGKEQRSCACGEIETNILEKVEHNFGDWDVTTPATCESEGEMKAHCTYCQLEKVQVIPVSEIHNLSIIVLEDEYCGENQVSSVYCSVCEEYVTSYGHHYIKSVTEATCTEDGEVRYTCDVCGDTYFNVMPATGHIESEYTITLNPTCANTGTATQSCVICDTLLSVKTLDVEEHSYRTNASNGIMTYSCVKCNHSYTEEIEKEAFTVRFISDGSTVATISVEEGTPISYIPELTKAGYDLAYWSMDDGTNAPYESQFIYEDVDLIAVWEEITVLDTHYSDIAVYSSVDTGFKFTVIAKNESEVRNNLCIYDIEDNEIEYLITDKGEGKFEIYSQAYQPGEMYYAVADGEVSFVGTESREIQFSIEGENRVEIEISDSVKWLEYSDVYGVIDGVDGKLLLTNDVFNVGDNVAIFEDSHENIVIVIKILSKNEQMGYNAYGFEMADYDQVFDKFEASVSGDLSDGVVTIDPAAEDEIRSAFMSSSLYASARAAAIDFGRMYDINVTLGENIEVKIATKDSHIIVTVKYTIEINDDVEINIIYQSTANTKFQYYIRSVRKYSVIETTITDYNFQINLSVSKEPERVEYRNAKDLYEEKFLEYLQKREEFFEVKPSEFEDHNKNINIGGVNVFVGPVNIRFSLALEFNFEFTGTFGVNLDITSNVSVGVINNIPHIAIDNEITGVNFFVQGKVRAELLLKTEIFANVAGFGIYINAGLGPYVELGGAGSLGYYDNNIRYTEQSIYLDAGHREEVNLGFKFDLLGRTFFKIEYELLGCDHSFNGMPIGSTEIWLGFEEYEEDVYINGDCSSNNQFDLDEIINTTIKYQDLKGDMTIEYGIPNSVTYALNSVSGYRSKIYFTNNTISFDSIGEEITIEIKVKVSDSIYKTITVHYTVNHEEGCSHHICANGYHIGGTATCTERAICTRCNLEYGPEPAGHVFDRGECSVCGHLVISEGLEYTVLDDGTYEVSGIGTCSDQYIVIPSEVGGIPVTSIGDYAFYGGLSFTSIKIPNSVTSIGDYAFVNCLYITSIEIPDSVTSIGDYAFAGAGLRNIEISDSVTNIGDYAFESCPDLRNVEIPNSVTSISRGMFSSCTLLTSIKIPDSVTSIGNYAFSDCTSLTNIEIGDSVRTIGFCAFSGCTSLTNIEIPDSVTIIGGNAFSGCTSLINIEIPNSVTNIGDSAFYYCTSLASIEIPSSVTSIGEETFLYCTSLVSIEIGNSVRTIGHAAFAWCTSLTNIEIPSSVTSIGGDAFGDCTSLTSIEIPYSVTSIGGVAFVGCISLTNIEIPDSVTYIGEGTFRDCTSLTIYCETPSKPSGWDSAWNDSNRPVIWGYTIE